MARVKFSALVTELRGSIGGTTFQSNAYGWTAKQKANMVRPNTPSQQRGKIALSRATKYWASLTDVQRAAWDTYASTYPQYARNNASSVLTGYVLCVKYHTLYWTLASSGPGLATPTLTNPAVDVAAPTLAVDVDSLNFNGNFSPASGNWYMFAALSRPFPATQNFPGTRTRLASLNTTDDTFSNLFDMYNELFGVIPMVGDYVYVKIQLVGFHFPMFPSPTFFKVQVVST